MDKKSEAFVAAAKRIEERANVHAFVVINPGADINSYGRYVIVYPERGHGERPVYAIAWLPGETSADVQRHHGRARGYGYDKATAAMGGAPFWNLKTGQMDALKRDGYDSRRQLEQAGYIVIQAC